MIIPPAAERFQFYQDLVCKCEASMPDRRQFCNQVRQYYLQGNLGNQRNVYQNRIRDKINLLSSFVYAQETTKFNIKFDAHVPPEQKAYADRMHEIALDDWHNSDTDRTFGDAVTWSLVFGTMFKKVTWGPNGIDTYPVEPHCLGVLREDTDRLAHQEALVMTFFLTRDELNRQIWNHPNRESILKRVEGKRKDDSATIPETVNRIIISQVSPNMVGSANVDGTGLRVDYLPVVEEELIECRELWVWDDFLREGRGDYRVWTCALPDITIYDRPNFFIPGEHPFIKISCAPLYNYIWGFSFVSALIGLQDWRDKRIGQIDKLVEKQLRPSRIGIGAGSLPAEKALALDSAGGFHNFSNPAAKIETYVPQMPADAWQIVGNIDEQMDEIMGVTRTLKGRGEEGIRSEGHAQFLGRMGSAPIRKLALLIEDSIEDEATLMLKVRAREDPRQYLTDKDEDGQRKKFLLSQVSPDYRVRVSAHSSSPIFAEENRQLAGLLYEAGAIDKQTLIEMLDPPMIEAILARLAKLEKGQAEQAKIAAQSEAAKTAKNVAQAQAAQAKAQTAPLRAAK